MESALAAIGGFWVVATISGLLLFLAIATVRYVRGTKPPQIVGTQLPVLNESIDLSKRYDILYGERYETAREKLSNVQILGYLRSDRDEIRRPNDYSMEGSRWLVVGLPDGRRAYLRPQSVQWLVESEAR